MAPNNSRILKEDVVLSGYKVPAGVSVVIGSRATNDSAACYVVHVLMALPP